MQTTDQLERWRRPVVGAAFLCLIALCLWQMYAFQRVEAYNADSTHYIVLAQNLAAGKGYVFNSTPHTRYPPGLPLILAFASAAGGSGYIPFIRLMPIFGALGLIAAFVLIEREEHWTVAVLACAWLACSSWYFRFATQYVWSDLPYFFASTTVLLLASRLERPQRSGGAVITTTALCLAMAAAVLIRSAAVALIGAAVATLVFAWRSLPRRSIVGLAAAAATGAAVQAWWMSWTRARVSLDYPGEYMHSYVAQLMMKNPLEPELGRAALGDLASRAGEFAATQMIRFSQLLAPVPWIEQVWFSPFVLVPGLFLAVGLVHSIARGRSPLLVWYVVAYLGLYSLWPFDEGTRFTVPVFPLLFLFGWRGVRAAGEIADANRGLLKWLVPALGVLALAALLSYARLDRPGRQALASVMFWFAAFGISFVVYSPLVPRALAITRRHGLAAAAAAFAICAGAGLASQVRIAAANLKPQPTGFAHAGVVGVAEWLRSQPGGVVMAQQTGILHRLTGRRIVAFPVSSDGRFVREVMRQHRVGYLVVAPSEYEYYTPSERERLKALLAADPGCCRLAGSGRGFEVYRVSPE
jgi:hypothetical protein